jgi:hypothetical protein
MSGALVGVSLAYIRLKYGLSGAYLLAMVARYPAFFVDFEF